MNKLFLALLLMGCGGGTTTGDDAATDGSQSNDGATDSSTTDSSTNDAAPNDSSTSDVKTGDGGLGGGSPCDPNNNQCEQGLLCCSEPTHNFDGGPLSAFVCETPTNGQCPKLP